MTFQKEFIYNLWNDSEIAQGNEAYVFSRE